MSQPGQDPWGVAGDAAPGGDDPWGVAANEDQATFSGDAAHEAIARLAPGAVITSQARTPEHNAAVGGVADSMHLTDQAADVVLPKGVSAKQFRAQLEEQGYPISEFLDEGNHVHWGWGPKGGKQIAAADPWAVSQDANTPRPLNPGEFVKNENGSWSNEITTTVRDKRLNGGKPTIIPTLWMVDGKPTRVSEDQAADYAAQSGLSWPGYKTMARAETVANAREKMWQSMKPGDSKDVTPLWGMGGGDWRNSPEQRAEMDDTEAALAAVKPGGDLLAPAKPSPGWWDVMKAAVTNTWPALKQQVAGAIESFGEHPEGPSPNIAMGAQEQETLDAPLRPARVAAGNQAAQFGRELYASAAADIKSNMPDLSNDMAKRMAYQVTQGTLEMLPVLAATAVTRNPVVGAAAMGGQAYAGKYGEARASGRAADQAAMDATFTGIVNGALGSLPLGALMKPGQTFLAKTLQSAGTFGAISVVTEALQLGYDKGLVTPDMTAAEAVQRLKDAGIVGVLQGAFLGGGHAGLEAAVNKLHAQTPAAAPEKIEPAAAATTGSDVAPAPPPANQPAGIHADIRSALGLEKAGVAPAVDPWGVKPPEAARSQPPENAGENARPTAENAQAPRAALPDTHGIARRDLEADTAVTSSGREVPVQYAVVEAGHLIPSQTQEGNANPEFPGELQPRDRTRAVSQAQIASIAQNINPRLLDRSPNASDGAPIISSSGVVESGNGRSLALQRAYADNLPAAKVYRDYLAQQGYPVDGMKAPVLVRVRTGEMAPEDRQAFVREANQSGQLGYSATERAMSDATATPDSVLDLYRGGDVESAANRDFVRGFMSHAVPATEHAGMVGPDGALSQEAIRRVQGALLAKAYADPGLVGKVVESTDSNTKAIGGALTDAAAEWSRMRAAANRGEIPPALDTTHNLLQAVQLVAKARSEGQKLGDLVSQRDIFTGNAIDPAVEEWLALMYRNTKDWTQPVGRDKLADAIKFYAQEAQKAQVGANLLGDEPVSSGEILSVAKAKQYGGQNPEPGASFSLGEDARTYGGQRAGSEAAPGATGPGEGAAQVGAEKSRPVVGRFGPRPSQFDFALPERPYQTVPISHELNQFMLDSGLTKASIEADPARAAGVIANYIHLRGRATGYESLAAFGMGEDLGGKATALTDSNPRLVKFTPAMEYALRQPNQNIVTFHNHPSNSSPSKGDLATTVYPGHKALVVLTHDGAWHGVKFAAKVTKPADPQAHNRAAHTVNGAWDTAAEYVKNHIDPLYKSGALAADSANHAFWQTINRAMDRAGLTEYQSSAPMPEAARTASENAVKEAAAHVRRFVQRTNPEIQLAQRDAEGPYRHPGPVQFADGMAQIFGGPVIDAGRAGGERSAPASAAAPGRRAEQLKLLEDERRYAETPEFKAWFGDSKIVDKNGKPQVLYHGTTKDFDAFNRGDNVEADWGRGIYFSNTPDDVAHNYAGLGPDISNRIERYAEQIASAGDDQGNDIPEDEAMRLAREKFVQHEGATVPGFVKMENPFQLGGKGETFLDYDGGYNPETEEYGDEESGKLVEFVNALRAEADELNMDGGASSVDDLVGKIMDESMESGGISASDLDRIIRKDEKFNYASDENGDLNSHEIYRAALEAAGFDGVIDHSVNRKFGSEKPTSEGEKMAGMGPGTVHYVAFKPTQVKSSIGNRGTFDPNDPNILREEENRYEAARPPFFSQLTRSIEESKLNRAPAKDWAGLIDNLQSKGVKQEEVEWSGVKDWLAKQTGPVTKVALMDHIRENEVRVEEVLRGTPTDDEDVRPDDKAQEEHGNHWNTLALQFRDINHQIDLTHRDPSLAGARPALQVERSRLEDAMDEIHDQMVEDTRRRMAMRGDRGVKPTKYAEYTIPGGANYRELLLTLGGGDVPKLPKGWKIEPVTYNHGAEITHEVLDDEGFQRGIGNSADDALRDAATASSFPLPGQPEMLRELPATHELIHDAHGRPGLQWGVIPKDQAHARPIGGWHGTKEEATQLAIDAINGQRYAKFRDELREKAKAKQFTESHWSEPNVLAHIRFDEREAPAHTPAQIDAIGQRIAKAIGVSDPKHLGSGAPAAAVRTGAITPEEAASYGHARGFKDVPNEGATQRILHMAEIQSDWHQKGRRHGYASDKAALREELKSVAQKQMDMMASGRFKTTDEARATDEYKNLETSRQAIIQKLAGVAVPDAPFKTSWHELALKRMLRYAAEHGYDKLSWDTGDTNADRYDLSKQVDEVQYFKNPDKATYQVDAYKDDKRILHVPTAKESDLEGIVGKDVAKRIVDGENLNKDGVGSLTGHNLKVGGEGMRAFYDKILLAAANKLGKKFGVKVESGRIPAPKSTLSDRYTVEQNRRGEYEVRDTRTDEIVSTHNLPGIAGREARKLNGDAGRGHTEAAHFIAITPEMRASLLKGQPLFEERPRYETEPGALDARGKPVDQTVIPGAERSEAQARAGMTERQRAEMEARMKQSKMRRGDQKAPGGMFGDEEPSQGSLFENEDRYGGIPQDDREALEKAARTGDWIGKYRAIGATPDAKIRSAIAGAFKSWLRLPTSVPERVRQIFDSLPAGVSDVPTTRPTEGFRAKLRKAADATIDLVHDAQMLIAPMAEGTNESRAVAKDFANMMRLARYHGNRMMEGLKKKFDHTQLRKMWEAADEESVLQQKGEATAGRGLATLTPEERRAVLEQQADAQNVWNAARDQGMVEGEGLPSYVPRMMVEMAHTGVERLGSSDAARSIPGIGRNLKTSTPQMKHRKHLTTEETEAAGSGKFNTLAHVVRDIRTLPMATMRLREAVAGRALINKVKEIGQKTGDETVVEGHEPTGTPYKWFTLDHPAFKTWRPKLVKNAETGKYEPAKDQNGDMQFEKVPLYVRGDFEGPLRAVLSQDSGKIYGALMNMKGRAMTAIMYSPLIHNAVEWGRALPAMPGKVATFRIYFEGNAAKRNPETMTEAIMHGLVPIGHQAGMQDITSIASPDSIAAGRSWTAKVVGAVPGLFSRDARDAVYRTIDQMGDLWHNTLLWDRVGDLQMGLYVNIRDSLIKKGQSPDAAQHIAAHFANRYAGALPVEAMSNMSRKLANLAMFSRTFTLGNLGAMKDVLTGLPRDVQAQIARSGTLEQLEGVKSLAARKALSILAVDIALFYASNSILQSAISYIAGREDLSEIEKGYADRLHGLLSKITESPLELLNPFADMQSLSATSENEPGRENRVLIGYDHNGTAIYARNPAGKIGEEFTNWLSSPIKTALSKMSPFLKPTYETITNNAGFGKQVYDPKAKGLSGLATNLGHVVSLYLSSQIPLDSLKSGYQMLKGDGSEIDTYKTLGPLAGVTFSKGAPGGPAVGVLFDIKDQQKAKEAAAMPDIIAKIKAGDVAGARKDMHALGIAPGLQNYYVRVTKNPRLRLQTKSSRAAIRNASPEDRARLNSLRGNR